MPLLFLSLVLQQDPPQDAGAIVSKMIARYHSAKKLNGDFTSNVKVGDKAFSVTTKFQIERPTKLYLQQVVSTGNKAYVVTSDGKEFSYMKPIDTPLSDKNRFSRLIEDVGPNTTLGEIVRASAHSMPERSAVLDLLVSDLDDLKFLRSQWKTVDTTGKVDLNGEQVYRVVGKWRLDGRSESTANYGMFITEAGDLRKYVIDGTFQLENSEPGAAPLSVRVTREFLVNATIDGEIDSKLFTVLKS